MWTRSIGPSCSAPLPTGTSTPCSPATTSVPVRLVGRDRHPPPAPGRGRGAGDVDSVHLGRSLPHARPDGCVSEPRSAVDRACPRVAPGRGRSGFPVAVQQGRCEQPVVLTLAQLRRWHVSPLPPSSFAHVVENPSVVVDAASRGWDGPVLVCSSGRPSVAVVTLLRQLGASGATLAQHADFDAAGLAITSWLAERAGTTPWRMGVRDYEDAVAGERERLLCPNGSLRRRGIPACSTSWPARGRRLRGGAPIRPSGCDAWRVDLSGYNRFFKVAT